MRIMQLPGRSHRSSVLIFDSPRALDANPSWREAVRARILGEELLQLPVKSEDFVQGLRTSHANIDARLDRIEGDTGTLKGDSARTRAIQDAQGAASDMGLEFVRTLSATDLSEMAESSLPRDPTETSGTPTW